MHLSTDVHKLWITALCSAGQGEERVDRTVGSASLVTRRRGVEPVAGEWELDREHGPAAALAGRPGGAALPGGPPRVRGVACQRRPRGFRRAHVHRRACRPCSPATGSASATSPLIRETLSGVLGRDCEVDHHRRPGGVAATRGTAARPGSDLRARRASPRTAPTTPGSTPNFTFSTFVVGNSQPVRTRRLPRGRRGARQGVQPALPVRRRRSRQDPPDARHRPRGPRDAPAARRWPTSRPRSS